MATRCNIVITDVGGFPMNALLELEHAENTIIYRHWDGYPEKIMPILKECTEGWFEPAIVDNILNYEEDKFRVESFISPDISYLYIIDTEEKTIRCYDAWGDEKYIEDDE